MSGGEGVSAESARDFAQALVDLYDQIDGVVDEMSSRDFRLTQEFYPRVEAARRCLTRPASTCVHEWSDHGSPDDHWQECWLCGTTRDRLTSPGATP